ncbi:MAG: hypothetical protein ABL900_15790 [Burkholderiaceae bacterium]
MTSIDLAPRRLRPTAKVVGLWVALVLLVAFVGYAALREVRRATPEIQTQAPTHAFADHRPAQSAADERFSQALWDIHADVRTAAVRVTFAGLSYKIGDADRASVSAKVTPLTAVFRQAESRLLGLDAPASMQGTRSRYASALQLYSKASLEMVKVTQDGNDAHLLKAQEMSEQASGILLEVSEQLWPGEIKPN